MVLPLLDGPPPSRIGRRPDQPLACVQATRGGCEGELSPWGYDLPPQTTPSTSSVGLEFKNMRSVIEMQTTDEIIADQAKKNGLIKVKRENLVKGCDYIIVYTNEDRPTWAIRAATFDGDEIYFIKWHDFLEVKKGNLKFTKTPQTIRVPAFGAKFYTYEHLKCDAELAKIKKRWNNHGGGKRTRRSKRVKSRRAHRRNTRGS